MKKIKKVVVITFLGVVLGMVYGYSEKPELKQATEILKPKLIPYRKGDKWGFYDKDKNIIIPIKYDEAYPFREGLARVKLNDKWFYIDKAGVKYFEER